MKKIKIVIVGYGDRGSIYGSYTNVRPENEEIVAVIDCSKERLELAKKNHNLDYSKLFTSLDDFKKAGIQFDLIINSTMDQIHKKILEEIIPLSKYVLTEKPIVNNKEDLLKLKEIADKYGTTVFVCHVLRYTPFYRGIKECINNGDIGEIISIGLEERVGAAHFSGSYVRGKWRSEAECGSTFLLAKSCHDTDLMCWLNNTTRPVSVSSFGSRKTFVEEKAPIDHSRFCYNCPREKNCIYSAVKLYVENDFNSELTHPLYHKEDITKEDRENFVRSDNFGRCVYDIEGNDLVDRQVLNVEFENGSVGTFTLVGGVSQANRKVTILGTRGEIEGDVLSNKFVLRKNLGAYLEPSITEFDYSEKAYKNNLIGTHSGGDFLLADTIYKYINGDKSSFSLTTFNDSIYSHLVVYAADESRKIGKIINIDELQNNI